MTILTIDEAAQLLRITKRTLYRIRDIPRVRIGHRLMFLKEDLEVWVKSHRESGGLIGRPGDRIDGIRSTVYHRNPLFLLPRDEDR